MHLSKPRRCTSPRVNFDVKYGLTVVLMCLGRLLFGKRCIIPVCYVNNGSRRICVMAGNTWGICVPSLCSCWEHKAVSVCLFVCLFVLRTSLTVQQLSLCLPMQRVRVWSLVWELRSCMPHSQKKKKQKTKKPCETEANTETKSIKIFFKWSASKNSLKFFN